MQKYSIPQFSTGEMLRAAVAAQTSIGLKAKTIIDSGSLVSDDIVIGLVSERIRQADATRGFILDGFPRTVNQAQALDGMLADTHMALDAVVELKVDEAALLDRIAQRAKETEAAGKPVRADDNPDVFKTRLDAYRSLTAPVSAYYAKTGRLAVIDGMAPVDVVSDALDRVLNRTLQA
jgi:adenylate kinase